MDSPPPDGLKPKHAINQVDSSLSLSNTVIARASASSKQAGSQVEADIFWSR
jgi:hypothetical protein